MQRPDSITGRSLSRGKRRNAPISVRPTASGKDYVPRLSGRVARRSYYWVTFSGTLTLGSFASTRLMTSSVRSICGE